MTSKDEMGKVQPPDKPLGRYFAQKNCALVLLPVGKEVANCLRRVEGDDHDRACAEQPLGPNLRVGSPIGRSWARQG